MTPAMNVARRAPTRRNVGRSIDHDDERAGRSADLHARATEHGDEEAGDDGGIESLCRRDATRDAERNRQRQRHDADDDAGREIVRELSSIVVAKGSEQLRDEH